MTMDQCYKLRFRTTIWNTYNRETRSNTLPSSGGTRSKTTPSSKAGISKVKNVKWGKPCYSYACLIALAIKSSNNCAVPIDQIYCFICEHFPYYQTVDAQWKKDIMHDLYKSGFFIEYLYNAPSCQVLSKSNLIFMFTKTFQDDFGRSIQITFLKQYIFPMPTVWIS